MEAVEQEEKGKKVETKTKGKKGFLKAFLNFLMMGGFLVVLIAILAIVLLISYLTK